MALREIIILPDKQLRLVSKPVEKVTAEIRKLADDMFETMYDAPGIGLAAIQVAQPLRLITMDLAKKDEDGESKPRPRVFINPEILSSSEELSVYEEGCLSIPEYYEEVERPAQVRVRFTDLDGKVHEEDADGLFATCIQHEIDHLNGVLFVDYLSKLKRDRVLKRVCEGRQARGGVAEVALRHCARLSRAAAFFSLRRQRPGSRRDKPGMTRCYTEVRKEFHAMPLRLIFMGTPDFAVPTLLELVAHGHEIAAVYTRAPNPPGAA